MRETVIMLTPASFAMSFSVTINRPALLSRFLLFRVYHSPQTRSSAQKKTGAGLFGGPKKPAPAGICERLSLTYFFGFFCCGIRGFWHPPARRAAVYGEGNQRPWRASATQNACHTPAGPSAVRLQ